jgi:hypothetical protein
MLVLWGCLSSIDETLCSLLQAELACLVEFDAWFDLSWFRGSMIFCIEKSYAFLTTLLSLKLGVCHPYCLVWGGACDLPWFEGELVLWRVYCIFCFSIAFASYSPKSLGFTCYAAWVTHRISSSRFLSVRSAVQLWRCFLNELVSCALTSICGRVLAIQVFGCCFSWGRGQILRSVLALMVLNPAAGFAGLSVSRLFFSVAGQRFSVPACSLCRSILMW